MGKMSNDECMGKVTSTSTYPDYFPVPDCFPVKEPTNKVISTPTADYPVELLKSSSLSQVANMLPRFLMLYKPFEQTAAIGLGALRAVFSLNELKNLSLKDVSIPPSAVLNTLVETASFAATIFMHPAGMLLTAVKDLVNECESLKGHLDEGRYTEAMECGAKVLSNALYLSAFAVGGVQLTIASLALQIGLGLYSAKKAYSQGSYIEAAGHLAMTLIMGKQLSSLASQLMPIQEENGRVEAYSDKEVKKELEKPQVVKEPAKPQVVNEPKGAKAEYTVQANTAQYKNSDYSNAVRVERGISLDEAKRIASSDPEIAYFFQAKHNMVLETNFDTSYDPLRLLSEYGYNSTQSHDRARFFRSGDTVFFKDAGKMSLGSALGQADTYIKNF